MKLGEAMYKASQAAGRRPAAERARRDGQAKDEDVVDAEFEEVDDDDDKKKSA